MELTVKHIDFLCHTAIIRTNGSYFSKYGEAVKERPIIFSAPMVRAIIDGRKTQTRRVIKPQPIWVGDPNIPFKTDDANPKGIIYCPYGKSGDRLWVRETFSVGTEHGTYDAPPNDGRHKVWYRATNPDVVAVDGDGFTRCRRDGQEASPWKSPIHMPRWASRINLEITNIRVERLRDISEEDAIAEGAQKFDMLPSIHPFSQDCRWSMENPTSTDQCLSAARMAYANYFEKINGRNSWNSNPWVWVIEFRKIEK